MDISKFTDNTLKAVQDFAIRLVEKHGTQSAAAASLSISDAHFISFRRADWNNISESLFNTIAAKAGISDWKLCETRNFSEIAGALDAAHTRRVMIGVTGAPGAGKTEATRIYANGVQGSYYLLADSEMSKSRFLLSLMREMGMQTPAPGSVIPGLMIEDICNRLIGQTVTPLIIIDDAGKLNAPILRILQIIYDRTKDRCGILLIGTQYLKKMLDQKAAYDVMGFRELCRRFAYWIKLDGITTADVIQVCKANGVSDPDAIRYLTQSVADYATLNFLISEAVERAAKNDVMVTRELIVAMQKGRS